MSDGIKGMEMNNGFCDCDSDDNLGMYICVSCQAAIDEANEIESEDDRARWELKQVLREALDALGREETLKIVHSIV